MIWILDLSKQTIYITLRATLFMGVLACIAWIFGKAFIFPSLGPSAYVLAFDLDKKKSHSAQSVIGGHACGILAGLFSYHLFVNPYHISQFTNAFAEPGLWLAIGSVVSLSLTVFLMLIFRVSHPPACATTLIISLGILPDLSDAIIIIFSVTILYLVYLANTRLIKSISQSYE